MCIFWEALLPIQGNAIFTIILQASDTIHFWIYVEISSEMPPSRSRFWYLWMWPTFTLKLSGKQALFQSFSVSEYNPFPLQKAAIWGRNREVTCRIYVRMNILQQQRALVLAPVTASAIIPLFLLPSLNGSENCFVRVRNLELGFQ